MWPKMKDLPRQIELKDGIWDVVFKHELKDHGVFCTGLCDPGEKRISIKTGQTPDERFATLLHEVIHAIEFEFNIDLGEHTVRKLEKGLMQFLAQVLHVG